MRKRVWVITSLAALCAIATPTATVSRPAGQTPQTSAQVPTADTLVRLVSVELGHGKPDAARTLITRLQGDAGAATATSMSLALVELFEGKDAAARDRLTTLVDAGDSADAVLELGLLEIRSGQRTEGRVRLSRMLQQAFDMTPASIFRLARAARALGDVRLANTLFQRIGDVPLQKAHVEATWGDMFLERRQLPEALASYRAALEADPLWIGAYLGLARVIPELADVNPAEGAAALAKAQELAPNHPDVWALVAERALDRTDLVAATEAMDKMAAARPASLEELALRAALAYAEGRTADRDALLADIRRRSPTFARGPLAVSDQAARMYRFDDAVMFAAMGVEMDPSDASALGATGLNRMRTGDEAGAREVLEAAFKLDPYNDLVKNQLDSLDVVDSLETVVSDPFVFKFVKADASLLATYAVPLATQAYETFSERYGISPEGPILIEVFSRHDDFAVRTAGLPGLVGALGACFGRVIAMDSPRAKEPGTFSWQATLWHEIAHVFSLQASDYRVPRWLTEGISVFEEHRYNKAWGREITLEFARALSMDRTFGVKGLPDAFKRPQDLVLAYFEASLLTEHLVTLHGDAGLRSLLTAYANGAKDADAFTQAFGSTVDDVEESFNTFVDERYGALARAMADERTDVDRDADMSVAALREIVAKSPGNYVAQWTLGQVLMEGGDFAGATEALERAVALAPMGMGGGSPRALLAQIALKQGNDAKAAEHLRALLEWDHDNVDVARNLVAVSQRLNDVAGEDFALKVIADVYPFDVEAHVLLGRRALARKDFEGALVELQAVIALGPTNRAESHADLAEAYLGLGRNDDAKREALKSLEQAPTYARAQDLLLAAIGRRV